MNDIEHSDVKAIAELIENQLDHRFLPESEDLLTVPYLILRHDQKVESIEHLLDRPILKRTVVSLTRPQSFVDYVNEQKEDDTRIFFQENRFVAVIDFHGKAKFEAEWCKHRAVYAMNLSEEWKMWTGGDKERFTQKGFAMRIEDNLDHIIEPQSAELVEMVRQFEANSNVEFKSWEKGDNGNFAVSFVQTTTSRAGQKGEVELPKGFTLLIPAYEGGEKKQIKARLQFDIANGKLMLWYELYRAKQILDEHTKAMCAFIEKETDIKLFYGTLP